MKKLLVLSVLTLLCACQHRANFKSANVIKPHLDAEITAEPEEQKVEIELQRFVYFDFNSAELSQQSKLVLDSHIEAMKMIKQGKIVLQGHTDQVGGEEFNHGLAKQRATSVWVYLVKSGISEEHLVAVSMGKGDENRKGADPKTDRHVEIMY
ncbi:OmpA family protein [Thalassomonas sp. M1454]|uniref:OmpA family protein n=1 Tax=Thalassomonas sp. M1454 TaxID=2594477 RepID=UPI00117CC733|nr:OmpA family protein [Thalassomonas sp. M1454]TRX57464.1 OmpA family protein [Thalassomonas sp. M1454]